MNKISTHSRGIFPIFVLGLIGILNLATQAVFAQGNKIEMITDSGRIVLKLYDNTPKNTSNMVRLTKEHFYDGILFHRVIPGFMIQGGDSTSKHAKRGQALGMGGLGYTIPAEINDSNFHKRGALAVARTQTPDKSGSACQFYIVTGKKLNDDELNNFERRTGHKYSKEQREVYKTIGGAAFLDGDYTVFGEVVEGMDVIDKIGSAARDRSDRPLTDIHIQKMSVLEEKAIKKKKRFFDFLRRKKNR